MSITAKSVVIDCADTWGGNYVELRSVEFFLNDVLLEMHEANGDFVAYHTSRITNMESWRAFETGLSKVGASTYTSWSSFNSSLQRIIIVFNTPVEFDRVTINPSHYTGFNTTNGAKNIVITASDDSITDITYNAAITTPTVLFDGILTEHTAFNVEHPVTVYGTAPIWVDPDTSIISAKAVYFDFTDNYGSTTNVSIRSIEFFLKGVLLDMVWDDLDFVYFQTSQSGGDYSAKYAFNTNTAKTGGYYRNQWLSWNYSPTPQRLTIVFPALTDFDKIVINNAHASGAQTNMGAKNISIMYSKIPFASTVYQESIADSIDIGTYVLDEHVLLNEADPQTVFNLEVVFPLVEHIQNWGFVTPLSVSIIQSWLLTNYLRTENVQPWLITEGILGSFIEKYGLKLASSYIELYDDNTLPLTSFVQWYYDANNAVSTNIHKYGDVGQVLKRIIERYGDTSTAYTTSIQKYNDTQTVLRSLIERYSDTSYALVSVVQMYKDASAVLRSITEKYGDAKALINSYKILYNVNYQAFASFVERYAITSNIAVSQAIQLYNLTALNPATATSKQLYSLLGDSSYASSGLILSYNINTATYQTEDISDPEVYLALLNNPDTVVSNLLVLINDTEFVDFIDVEITSTKTSFFMDCTIEVPDRSTWLKFEEGDIVKVINVLNEFTFMVKSKTRSFTSVSNSKYSIELESPTVKLIGPYAKTFSEDYAQGTAKNIVEVIASDVSIDVEWDMLDWTIPDDTLYASDEFPIEVIKKVVHSAGGITQSTPEGNLSIIREYPESPPYWEGAIPIAHISSEEDVYSVTETPVENDGYNHYYVTDQETTDIAPSLVTEEVSSYVRTAKLFLVPFSAYADKTITLETTSDDIDIYPPIGSALIVFTETIIDELVEFKDGVGTLSNPCYGGLIVDPEDLSLGDVEYTEDGSLTVEVLDGYSEGYTLAKITYDTKYYKWTVTNNASEDVQLFARIV